MPNTSEGRKKAWETRRAKYGNTGYGKGAYSRSLHDRKRADRMEAFIIKLHLEGILTEGQAAQATGLDRIQLRVKADEFEEPQP